MTTGNDICTSALRTAGVLGVGMVPLAEDINDAFNYLNEMLGQWQRQRWLIFHLVDSSVTSTGANSYTVGPQGDFNVDVRPDRLEAAFLRQIVPSVPNQVDYPLEIIEARETYNLIALKQLQSFPDSIYYDAAFPLGIVYPYPVPQANIYSVHITLKAVLAQITNLANVVNLPLEYFAAIRFNLAQRLRMEYDLPQKMSLDRLAKSSLNIIRNANTQIPRLQMPIEVTRPGLYNFFTDRSY